MTRRRTIARILLRLSGILASTMVLCMALGASPGLAHEIRPAYLQLMELGPGTFDVLFKTPMVGDRRLDLAVAVSGDIETTAVVSRSTGDAMIQTWQMKSTEPLAGRTLRIEGLDNTMTDVLVRIEFMDGSAWLQRFTPASPQATIPARQSGWDVALGYLRLGIEHILLGIDHLLFVLGLLLLTPRLRQLVKAITAFTVAHSITLAAATLGVVAVPPRPIEAAIALSIVFVAAEIVRARQGRIGIAASAPWLVAFTFGLLHGFGFAGALSEIGMPPGHIPEALLFFNVGVEAGQLAFVAAAIGVAALVRASRLALPQWASFVPPYLIGSVATFWAIERISAF